MKPTFAFETVFVTAIPETLENRILYVSMVYATVAHKCCCGCGQEVVTPLSPTDWKLSYDGVAVSLRPSIGNWSFPCRSHYWIDKGTVRWADDWALDQVNAGRVHDRVAKDRFYGAKADSTPSPAAGSPAATRGKGLWTRFEKWLSRE